MLMYFKVCSNSAYPQHSGERYRTSGPLVFYFDKYLFREKLLIAIAPAIRNVHNIFSQIRKCLLCLPNLATTQLQNEEHKKMLHLFHFELFYNKSLFRCFREAAILICLKNDGTALGIHVVPDFTEDGK